MKRRAEVCEVASMKQVSILAALLVLASGCMKTIRVGTLELWEDAWYFDTDKVLPLAAFDLKCPADQIVLVPLETETDAYGNRRSKNIGATGCDGRGRYMRVLLHGEFTWVLESRANTPKEKRAPAEKKATPPTTEL